MRFREIRTSEKITDMDEKKYYPYMSIKPSKEIESTMEERAALLLEIFREAGAEI